MQKKIISLMITIVVILSVGVNVCAGALSKMVVFDANFESGLIASSGNISGTNISAFTTEDGRNVLKADSSGGSANIVITANGFSASEATVISFDASFDVNTTRGYMDVFEPSRSMNVNDLSRGWYITHTGMLSYFESFTPPSGTFVKTFSLPYNTDQWYHFDMWIDYTDEKVYYFIDGKETGCVPFTSDFAGVGGFRMTVDGMNGGGTYLFDNIKIVNFAERGKAVNTSGIMGIPENFEDSVIVNFDTDKNPLGFIYMKKDVVFNADLKNVCDCSYNTTVEMKIYDEQNNVMAKKEIPIIIESGALEGIRFTTRLDKYGFYYIETVIKDNLTSETLARKRFQFSVVNAPEDGLRNKKIGFTDHTATGHGLEEMERKLKLLADAGAGIIRADFVNPVDDTHKRYADVIAENDMNILAILTYGKIPPVTENEYLEWEKYVAGVATDFKDKTQKVIYDVWNEYNGTGFNYIGATADDYVNLLKHTYKIIKDIDPDAQVNGFVVTPQNVEDSDAEIDAIDWMRDVLEAGGGDYMDAACIHVYTHARPENISTKRGKLITETRALLDKFGYNDMKIVVSETGWTTDGVVSEKRQADWLVRWMVMNHSQADETCWYVSQEKETASTFENLYGFTRAWTKGYAGEYPEYGAKPAFLSFASYNALMTDARFVQKCDMGSENIYNYQFVDRNMNDVFVVWKTGSQSVQEVAVDCESVAVYDVYGNAYPFEKTQNGVSLTLTESPVYIVESYDEAVIETVVDYNTNTVTVKGNTKGNGDNVGISVVAADGDPSNINNTAYIGQVAADAFGNYSVRFKNGSDAGAYILKAGFDNGTVTKDLTISFSIPKLTVTSGGDKVEALSELKAGDELTAEIRHLDGSENIVTMVAQYRDGRLEKVDVCDTFAGTTSDTVNTTVNPDIDCIKVMVWNRNINTPIMGVYEIE